MKRQKNLSGWMATWFAVQLFFYTPCFAQTLNTAYSPEEHYLNLLRLQKTGNHQQVMTESVKLIEHYPQFARFYSKLIESATALNLLPSVGAYFEVTLKKNPANAQAHYGLALFYRRLGQHKLVIEQARLCQEKAPKFAAAYAVLADAYQALNKAGEAEVFFKSIHQGHPGFAAASYGLGYLFYQSQPYQSRWAESLTAFDQALTSEPAIIEAREYKAFILYYTNRYSEALTIYQSLFEIAKAHNDLERQTRALISMGTLRRILGEHASALGDLTTGLRGAEEIGNQPLQLSCLGSLAGLALRQDDYESGLAYGKRWLEMAKLMGVRQDMARALGHLGVIYRELGNIEEAIEVFKQSITDSRQIKDEYNLASVLTDLAGVYIFQKNYDLARDCLDESLVLTRNLRSRALEQDTLVFQAHLQFLTKDYLRSWETQSSALRIAREMKTPLREGISLNSLGGLKLNSSEWQAAQDLFEQALALGEKIKTPSLIWQAYAGLAAAAKGQSLFEQARNHYQQSINIIEMTRTELRLEEERTGFFQDKVEVYRKQIGLYLQMFNIASKGTHLSQAFHVAERARARAFSDILAEAKVNLENSLDAALLKQQQPLQQAISDINAKLLKARALMPEQQDKAEIEKLETELGKADERLADWWRERNRRYADLKYPEPATLLQTQQLLAPDQVMLAYSLGAEESYLFAVSRDGYQVWKLPAAQELNTQAEELLKALIAEQAEAGVWRQAATGLYQALIQPAATFLRARPAARELIILPDGALHRIPFEVLLEPISKPITDSTKLPYLVKRYALSYAPSATVLKSLKETPPNPARKPKELIVFADPQYEQATSQPAAAAAASRTAGSEQQWNFKQLSRSAREAQGIARVFAARGGAELYLGEQANEAEVKSPQDRLLGYRVVHFSAHGVVNERRPRFSGLVLTLPTATQPAETQTNDDGILSAYEIFNLKLNAELVTLSACETGLGKEVKGEGLMSLARGFMYAGTPSVLASLWKVDDAGTADLMIDFYRFWQQGKRTGKQAVKLNKAAALREAQLKAIAAGSHPFYWAPFVLLGRSN